MLILSSIGISILIVGGIFFAIVIVLAAWSSIADRRGKRYSKINQWGADRVRDQRYLRSLGGEPSLMDLRFIEDPEGVTAMFMAHQASKRVRVLTPRGSVT